jgi:quinol-cytochrome oxidoreductase complex cytochrome b subunit
MLDARWLLFPALIAIGWASSRRQPSVSRIVARCSALVIGIALGLITISGLLQSIMELAGLHKWSGHGLLILIWLSVPFSIGVLLQQRSMQYPARTIGYSLAMLLALVAAFLGSITGYLGPSGNREIGEKARNRFIVLHCFVLPAVLAALICVWIYALRSLKKSTTRFQNDAEPL